MNPHVTTRTPEMTRLLASLPIKWPEYHAWVDANYQRANAIGELAEFDGEDGGPIIKAQFLFETWARPQIPTVYPPPADNQARRDIAKTSAGVAWLRALLIVWLVLPALGCTTLRTPTQTPDSFPSAALEATYQVANALDNATTVNLARRPDCYRETGFPTAELLGHHPSEQSVEAYWALESVAHLAVSAWLDREVDATDSNGWRIARGIWYAVSIGASTRGAVDNYRLGLRPFGSGAAARCEKLP